MTAIFNTLAKKPFLGERLSVHEITHESESVTGLEFVSFTRPTDVLVSRWYPGYRVTDLTGKQADEGIGLLLAHALRDATALEGFRRLLATPDLPTEIVTTLLPRPGVPIKGREYHTSEAAVGAVVADVLQRRAAAEPAIVTAYAHAITRVLSSLGLVQPGVEKRVVNVAPTYVITADDIKRVILVEAMRDVFSDARLASATRDLGDTKATPQVIGDSIARAFRSISHVIPEIKLRLEQLEIVTTYVALYHGNPTIVPNALQAHPALVSLSSLANFVVFARRLSVIGVQPPAASITETKEAFNNILTVIQSAPSIELVSLTQYAEYFGEVPVSSPDGIRRGLVLYKANCQTSKMEVADARKVSAGYELAQLSPEYVRSSGLAAPLSGSLLTTESMAGLANIVADEMSMTEVEVAEDCTFNPKLFAIQVTDDDLMLLAMAKSEAVAYVKASVYVGPVQPTAPLQLLFGCTVSEQWRMSTFASTPLMAFFLDPAAVIVYKSAMTATLSKPMPSRPQSLGLIPASDMVYANLNESNIEEYLLRQVERPFTLKVPLQSLSGETVIIDLEIMVLAALLGYDPTTYPERSGAFYAAVREPGVDDETRMMLQIALAYALEGGNILGDKAKSWVIERLAPLMMHPAVQQLTTRSINASIIKQKLDARSMAPQFKELVLRSYFGVAMAILARFGKLDGDTAAELTRVLPITGLSVKSQLALAAMPHQLNASYLRDAT